MSSTTHGKKKMVNRHTAHGKKKMVNRHTAYKKKNNVRFPGGGGWHSENPPLGLFQPNSTFQNTLVGGLNPSEKY